MAAIRICNTITFSHEKDFITVMYLYKHFCYGAG